MFTHHLSPPRREVLNRQSLDIFVITKEIKTDKSKIEFKIYVKENNKRIAYLIGVAEPQPIIDNYGGNSNNEQTHFLNERFSLEEISVDGPYQNKNLGLLLIYLFSLEVKINNGRFIYISLPYRPALAFYSQYGFYPEPSIVSQHLSDSEIPLEEKIRSRYRYSEWRGSTQHVCNMLETQVLNFWWM